MKMNQISKFLSPNVHPSTSQEASSLSSDENNELSRKNSKVSLFKLNESVVEQKNSKNSKKSNDGTPQISKYFNLSGIKEKEEKIEKYDCPLCSKDLTSFNESDRQSHVNTCLDKGYASTKTNKFSTKSKPEDSKAAETPPPKLEPKKPKPVDEAEPSPSDNTSAVENVQKKFNETILKEGVPNCPICGKVLHSLNIRQSHLKKCAQTYHIRTESLVELVKKQQERIERDLAKGLVPTDVYISKQKKQQLENPNKPKKNKITNRVIKSELPQSKQDEQFQLAIALSNSINPAEDCPQKAEIKLFKASKNQIKKVDTQLQLLDDDARALILSKRLSALFEKFKLNPDLERDGISEKSSLIKTKFKKLNETTLWDKCKYFGETEDSFYVKLFLDIGKVQVGHQLFVEKMTQDKFSNIEVINTQTAFLLADLNDQTQENISIYYTQYQQHVREMSSQSLNESSQIQQQSQMVEQYQNEDSAEDSPSKKDDSAEEIHNDSQNSLFENSTFSPNATKKLKYDQLDDSRTNAIESMEEYDRGDGSQLNQTHNTSSPKIDENKINHSSHSVSSDQPDRSMNSSTKSTPVINRSLESSVNREANNSDNLSVNKSLSQQISILVDDEDEEDELVRNLSIEALSQPSNTPKDKKNDSKDEKSFKNSLQASFNNECDFSNECTVDISPNKNKYPYNSTEMTSNLLQNVSKNLEFNEDKSEINNEKISNNLLFDSDQSQMDESKPNIIIDETTMSSSSSSSEPLSPRYSSDQSSNSSPDQDLLNENVNSDENLDSSSSSSNILDKNMEIIDDDLTNDSDLSISPKKNNLKEEDKTLNTSKNDLSKENVSAFEETLLNSAIIENDINDTIISSNKSILNKSNKRKSVDTEVILVDDNSSSLECFLEKDQEEIHLINVNRKKFKKDSFEKNVIQEEDLEIISSDGSSEVIAEKEACSSNKVLENESKGSENMVIIDENDDEMCNEEELLALLECTNVKSQSIDCREQNVSKINQNNDVVVEENINDNIEPNDELDDVWMNFGEEQYDCGFEYNDIDFIQDSEPKNLSKLNKTQNSRSLELNQDQMNSSSHSVDTENDQTETSLNSSYKSINKSSKNSTPGVSRSLNTSLNLEVNNVKNLSMNKSLSQPNPVIMDNDDDDDEEILVRNLNLDVISSPVKVASKKPPVPNNSKKIVKCDSKNTPLVPMTPMPDYHQMNTPNLKEQLKKYGVKALPKRQAVKKLIEIFDYTHRNKSKVGMPRSQSCTNFREKTVPSVPSFKPSISNINIANDDDKEDTEIEEAAKMMNLERLPCTQKKTLKKSISDINFQRTAGNTQATQSSALLRIGLKKTNPNKATQKQTQSSQRIPSVDIDDNSDSESQSTQKKKNKASKTYTEEETKKLVIDTIKNDNGFYLKILNYEPVDFETLHNKYQEEVAPRRVNNKVLMKVLDELCVTFTLKSLNTRSYGRAKSKKKN